MDWKEELLKRLDALAAKLGTTSTYLWHVLVKQGYVEGIDDLLFTLIWAVLALICYRLVKKSLAMPDNTYSEWTGRKMGVFFPSLAVGLVAFFISMVCLYYGIQEMANPEFVALQHLLAAK